MLYGLQLLWYLLGDVTPILHLTCSDGEWREPLPEHSSFLLWQDETWTVLCLSPLGHSTGKGDGDVAIVPVPGKVVSGSQGFPTVAVPVHFVPRHVFILHFCGFSGEEALRVLSSWVSWAGGEDKKGRGKAVKRSQCSEEPRKQTARKKVWLQGLISLGSTVGAKTCGMTKICRKTMLMFGDKPCLSALRVRLGFYVSLQGSHTCGSHGRDTHSICPPSVLLADRATGRINTGYDTLLRPHNLKNTLQKGVCSPASPRELELHFLLRVLRFLLIGRKLLAL